MNGEVHQLMQGISARAMDVAQRAYQHARDKKEHKYPEAEWETKSVQIRHGCSVRMPD